MDLFNFLDSTNHRGRLGSQKNEHQRAEHRRELLRHVGRQPVRGGAARVLERHAGRDPDVRHVELAVVRADEGDGEGAEGHRGRTARQGARGRLQERPGRQHGHQAGHREVGQGLRLRVLRGQQHGRLRRQQLFLQFVPQSAPGDPEREREIAVVICL